MKAAIELAKAGRMASEVEAEIAQWIRLRDKVKPWVQYNAVQRIKLLKLQVWATRHYIPVLELLDLLVPVLRGVVKKKSKGSLGVSIGTLTGKKAGRIVAESVQKRYPEGEQVEVWKEQERERQVQVERAEELEGMAGREKSIQLADFVTNADYVAAYRQGVMAERVVYRRALRDVWRKRKQYRGNPWL